MATIGWSQERTDEVLVPVVKDMNRRENEGTQANITQFFGGGVGVGVSASKTSANDSFAPRRRVEKSQRMANALGRLHARARESTMGEGEAQGEGDAQDDGVGQMPDEQTDGNGPQASTDSPRRTIDDTGHKPRSSKKRAAPTENGGSDAGEDSSDEYTAPKKTKRGTKGKKAPRKSKA